MKTKEKQIKEKAIKVTKLLDEISEMLGDNNYLELLSGITEKITIRGGVKKTYHCQIFTSIPLEPKLINRSILPSF